MSHDNKYINKLNDLEVSLKTTTPTERACEIPSTAAYLRVADARQARKNLTTMTESALLTKR